MRERLQPETGFWNSFLIEFPQGSQVPNSNLNKILFTCPSTETNAAEICFALFGPQILISKKESGDYRGSDASIVFIYSSNKQTAMNAAMEQNGGVVDVPVLVAHQANAQKSAQCVLELIQNRSKTSTIETPSPETTLDPLLDSDVWGGPLTEVVLTDREPNVAARTDVQDYRAEYSCRYVLKNYSSDINRDKMANLVHLSPGYFSNMFRLEVGMSFSDYLIQVRIDGAKAMLRRFELSVEEISAKCGFNSLAHFSRTFKERTGVSPLKYRKNPVNKL